MILDIYMPSGLENLTSMVYERNQRIGHKKTIRIIHFVNNTHPTLCLPLGGALS